MGINITVFGEGIGVEAGLCRLGASTGAVKGGTGSKTEDGLEVEFAN